MLRFASFFVCALLVLAVPAQSAKAASPAERGRSFAKLHCARCHAIGPTGESQFKQAPPFRTLHLRYPVETLGEALAEGIVTGHPDMPQFELRPRQIYELLSYLKTLE